MASPSLDWVSSLASLATAAVLVFLSYYLPSFRSASDRGPDTNDPIPSHRTLDEHTRETPKDGEILSESGKETEFEELEALKQLYYQLHSLEEFPEVVPKAKRLLLTLLKETSIAAYSIPEHESILSVSSYSRDGLEDFQRRRDKNIGSQWEQYNLRRQAGAPRELFGDREEAIWWLKQLAPVKFVDGAWLGRVGTVTAPFALLKTMKGLWQILSEELGDGDLERNHVRLYHKLLESVAPGLPTAEVLEFGHARHGLNNLAVWKAAIAQLLVCLSPNEFLPEILGFNLHFEAVSMETLKATKELKEVGIDPYYFILHVSIDNAHSGHTAIAVEVVCCYMEHILRNEGKEAAHRAWRKILAGYLLSHGLPGSTIGPSRNVLGDGPSMLLSPIESEVLKVFKAKAQVIHGIHCSSRIKIGPRSIADWLDPVKLESNQWQCELLNALSSSRYWIRRGDSRRSRFIQELQWNGRMFGSFTQEEYNTLRRWIDDMPNVLSALQDEDTGQAHDNDDIENILTGYPVSSIEVFNAFISPPEPVFTFLSLPSLKIGRQFRIENFIPLWFSHPCLLQSFVSVPIRTKDRFTCNIVKVLRAQGGFGMQQECVAGLSELRRPDNLSLVGIGLNVMMQHEFFPTTFSSLKDVLQTLPSDFAENILCMALQPLKYKAYIIGMASAFAKMHFLVAQSSSLLPLQDRAILEMIAQRELEGLEICWRELMSDKIMHARCCEGYSTAACEINNCFEP